jgi:hypothetical protein
VERPELKLVADAPEGAGTPAATSLGAAVLVAAGLATLFGADAARRPFAPAPLAESALALTLSTGDTLPAKDALAALNLRLRRNPLDGTTRTIAASLMAETAASAAERAAAVKQALAAIRVTPSEEHVAHGAARVLARCGYADLALREVARMFDYNPNEAAATLFELAPFVPEDRLETGLQDTPEAWLAYAERLRRAGLPDEADARLTALLTRWPEDLPALGVAASAAASRDRMDDLVRLVPPTRSLPETAEAARLYAYRARTKAAGGDAEGARSDAARAAALSNDAPWVLALSGDALASVEPELARDYWTRALYRLASQSKTQGEAIWLRYRLARLDDRQGRAGDALREWRTILAARPDDAEAKRRVQELTGERSP